MRVRITFSKQGALRYTGHLDLHRLWERAARRADLPLAYSQGFHPQPKINLAAALPLGFSSRCEMMDMKLETDISLDDLPVRLQASLPHDIQVLKAEQVDDNAPALQTQVDSAEYEVTLTESVTGSDLKRKIAFVMESTSLPRERRGKSYDLRPLIRELKLTSETTIFMRLLARENATGRPEEVLDVVGIEFEGTRIERSRLLFTAESLQ
ncbi:MAG: TIGR03936 family radical SAM-associated protein [Anaerolineales bacterium]|nr:TIGR03936 family radical SAM-associated protein [Anaerolineales bacterium]